MGYILNFQNNFNNMKNEIGRKLTSLTLMTIMFAGGLTLAIPGFMPDSAILPEAFADQSTTNGQVTVSSSAMQGAQVLQVTVSDSAISNTGIFQNPATMDFNSSTLQLTQVTDGSWVAYVADLSSAVNADAIGSTSLDFGTSCGATLAVPEGFTESASTTYLETVGGASSGTCDNPNGGTASAFSVLTAHPAMVHADANITGMLHGQVGHDIRTATTGITDDQSWPFIYAIDFSATNYLTYGDDTVLVTYGPQEAGASITAPDFVTLGQNVPVTITDNGLNIDPTTAETWTFGAPSGTNTTARTTGATTNIIAELDQLGFGENGVLGLTDSGSALTSGSTYVFVETGSNTGVFTTHDAIGESTVDVKTGASVDDVITFTYGGATAQSIVATSNASASMDAGAEWMPAEAATYTVTDPDMNKYVGDAEILLVQNDNVVPTIKIGTPLWLTKGVMGSVTGGASGLSFAASDAYGEVTTITDMGDDSGRVKVTLTAGTGSTDDTFTINTGWDASTKTGSEVLYYNICSITDDLVAHGVEITVDGVAVLEPGSNAQTGITNNCSGEIQYTSGTTNISSTTDASVALVFTLTHDSSTGTAGDYVIAANLNNYEQSAGVQNSISYVEAAETGPDTGVFEGTVTYALMNLGTSETAAADYTAVDGSDVIILLDNYLTGSSAPRVNYGDTDVLGSANVTVGAQADANTHSATVSFDSSNYAVGDAATVTVVDADLNTDNTIIEVYTGNSDGTAIAGTEAFVITCNDGDCASTDPGTVKLVEDGVDSDTFIGVFTVPDNLGQDLEIGYTDSRDATGTNVVWYATSTISSSTGTISLDRQVYPVPFTTSELKSGDNTNLQYFTGDGSTEAGTVTVTVAVTDPDFTDDQLKATTAPGTVNLITSGTTTAIYTFGANTASGTELGPMTEVEQGSNVYEISFTVAETQSSHQVLGGKTVIQVKYADTAGDTGLATNAFDSSTFDLRNGALSADKSVYIMGQDMVITLTDDDMNLNSDSTESYTMGLLEWDSSANSSILMTDNDFTSNPTTLEETGDSTGVFQTVVTIPTSINSTALELGESITITYRDAGRAGEQSVAPSSSDTVSEDVELSIATSNFGASISLDKTVYDWTDTVNIEVVAPDHNKNSNKKESIGTAALPVKVSTRDGQMCSSTYTLKENGEDTGIFTGYVVLQGLNGQNINGGTHSAAATACNSGPEDGKLRSAGQDDGVTVTYEYDDGSVALASAIIQWNFASIEFLDSSVSSSGSTVIRVTDPDEDLDDEVIDQITIDIYSDSDSGGLTKVLSETDEGTGIFEGTINFTTTGISSGNVLRVSEGDTVTAENTDKQLPGPDYTASDDLLFAATTTVGTAFPPLERAPASSARVVDASGNSVAEVSVDQQVQIAADVTNGQGKDQAFAYLVQVQDASGVTVSLSWLTGSLTSGQSMTAAQSWTPTSSGSYTATVFVWESVSNPTALSPTVSVNIDVV